MLVKLTEEKSHFPACQPCSCRHVISFSLIMCSERLMEAELLLLLPAGTALQQTRPEKGTLMSEPSVRNGEFPLRPQEQLSQHRNWCFRRRRSCGIMSTSPSTGDAKDKTERIHLCAQHLPAALAVGRLRGLGHARVCLSWKNGCFHWWDLAGISEWGQGQLAEGSQTAVQRILVWYRSSVITKGASSLKGLLQSYEVSQLTPWFNRLFVCWSELLGLN